MEGVRDNVLSNTVATSHMQLLSNLKCDQSELICSVPLKHTHFKYSKKK